MEKKFKLPKGQITVKPIIRPTFLIPDVKHEASFLVSGARKEYVVPLLKNSGIPVNVLTDLEKEFFESPEGGLDLKPGDLSVYKKDNNYWYSFRIALNKDELTLDKSNPYQYLQYKVLLANNEEIASSLEELRHKKKPTYKYVLVDTEEESKVASKEADIEEHAWSNYGEIKNDRSKMFDVLRIYGKKPSKDATDDFLRAQIKSMLKESPAEFVSITNDPNLEIKLLIEKAISKGAITKKANSYSLPGGDKIGTTLFEAAEWLSKPENQEIYLNIQTKVGDL